MLNHQISHSKWTQSTPCWRMHIQSETTPDTAAPNGNVEPGQLPSLLMGSPGQGDIQVQAWHPLTCQLSTQGSSSLLWIRQKHRAHSHPFRPVADSSATPDPPHNEAPPSALLGPLEPLPETGAPLGANPNRMCMGWVDHLKDFETAYHP